MPAGTEWPTVMSKDRDQHDPAGKPVTRSQRMVIRFDRRTVPWQQTGTEVQRKVVAVKKVPPRPGRVPLPTEPLPTAEVLNPHQRRKV